MAATDKLYVSGISLLDTREILPQVVDIQNQVGLTDMMGVLGRYYETPQAIFHNYVNKPLWVPVTVDTVDAGDSSASVTVTLTAGTSGNIRVNDVVRAPGGEVLYVHSITGSPNQLVLKTVDATNWNATAADVLYVFSNGVGEKSTARTNQRRDLTKYYNLIQIFREYDEQTDIAKMSEIEVEYQGKKYFYVKDYIEKFLKHKAEVNAAAFASKISASQFSTSSGALTDPQGGGTLQFQRGIDQYISSYGSTRTVDSTGTCDLDDVGKMIDLFIAKKAELSFLMFGANGAVRPLDNELKGLGSSTVTSSQLTVDGKEINFGVEKFEYSNAKFQKMNLPIMDNPDLMPADLRKYIYFIPTGKVKAQSEDGKSFIGESIRMRYMPHQVKTSKGNKIWAEWYDGALSPVVPVGSELVAKTHWATYQAVEVLGAEHFGRMKTLA